MIQAFGAIIGLWGILLVLLNKRNRIAPWMIFGAVVLLAIGYFVSPSA